MRDPDGRTSRVARWELSGFSVCAFELEPGYRLGTHAHDRSGLVLPLAGRFRAIAGRKALEAAGDRVAILPGDAPHHESVGSEGARCLLVVPHGNRPLADNDVDLDAPADRLRPDLVATGRLLWRELYVDGDSDGLVAEGLLLDLFGASPTEPSSEWVAAPAWVRRVEELVRDRYAEPLAHEEIAREVGVSREHLARSFRRFAGIPLGVFVRRVRVLRAARRLREGRRTISQIAHQCGFADQSHLTRTFRMHFHQTPAQYQARIDRGRTS